MIVDAIISTQAKENYHHESENKDKRALTTPDGHRANTGWDSLNHQSVPGPQDFITYFERLGSRGTLVLQVFARLATRGRQRQSCAP